MQLFGASFPAKMQGGEAASRVAPSRIDPGGGGGLRTWLPGLVTSHQAPLGWEVSSRCGENKNRVKFNNFKLKRCGDMSE